jgi:hypothetical protein
MRDERHTGIEVKQLILSPPFDLIDTRAAQLHRVATRKATPKRGVKYPSNPDSSSSSGIAQAQRRRFYFRKFGHGRKLGLPYAKLKQDGPCA